ADPFRVEGIGANDQRGQDFVDQSHRTRLGFAAPNTGDAGLSQAGTAHVIRDADQYVLAGDMLAERADDGEIRLNLAGNRFGVDCGDSHGSSFDGLIPWMMSPRAGCHTLVSTSPLPLPAMARPCGSG